MPGSSPQVSPFAAAPISHSMAVPVDEAALPDFLQLPDAPAVVVFESPDGRTLLLATTASARDLVRRRLTVDPDERTSRVNLRAVCAGGAIRAIQVGSSLEADAVYLYQAHERLPELARVVSERWRAWFAHVDPDAPFPQWTKTNLMVGLVGKRSASTSIGGGTIPPGVVLGPLPDKDAAGRFIESVIDCFDLCRYHNLLVQAPGATACAYKEMGRCPAPCDGSESMERYRLRVRGATQSVTGGVAPAIARSEQAMLTAASTEEFEKAAALQKAIARLKTLDKPAFSQVRSLHEWQDVLVLPSPSRKHATVALFDRGSLHRVGDVNIDDADSCDTTAAAIVMALKAAGASSPSQPPSLTPGQIETIGLMARWLFLPKSRRKGELIPAPALAADSGLLARTIRALHKSAAKGEPAIESHEIEGAA